MDDKRDGFMEQAAEKARELFSGSGDTHRAAATVPAEPGSHYGAHTGGGETRVGGASTMARYEGDPHYAAARARALEEFDRDYHAYRQERVSPGCDDNDFGAWRMRRQGTSDNSRALGENPAQGSDGPHILDRSFSGTYDKS